MAKRFYNVVICGTKDIKTGHIQYTRMKYFSPALNYVISSPNNMENQSTILSPFHEITLTDCNESARVGYLNVKDIRNGEVIRKRLIYDYDHILHLETIEVPLSKEVSLVLKANQFYIDPYDTEEVKKIFECDNIKANKIYSTLVGFDEKQL